jgi:hypothetical protein
VGRATKRGKKRTGDRRIPTVVLLVPAMKAFAKLLVAEGWAKDLDGAINALIFFASVRRCQESLADTVTSDVNSLSSVTSEEATTDSSELPRLGSSKKGDALMSEADTTNNDDDASDSSYIDW